MSFEEIASIIAKTIEGAGIAVMVGGILYSLVRFLFHIKRGFHDVRRGVGESILLGLELLVAADIIHTISSELTFRSVGTLAAIVVIRTFVGFSLTLEIEGRWPWQRAVTGAPTHAPAQP